MGKVQLESPLIFERWLSNVSQ